MAGLDSLTSSCVSHDGPEKYSDVSEFGSKAKTVFGGRNGISDFK